VNLEVDVIAKYVERLLVRKDPVLDPPHHSSAKR
jgi:riboflavin synthase alpha subunit